MVKRREIYLVDLGKNKGSVINKTRPALIIQNDQGNKVSPTTIIALMTSKNKPDFPFNVKVNEIESSLNKEGIILLDQIITIDKSQLIKKLGELNVASMHRVDKAIKISLNLNSD